MSAERSGAARFEIRVKPGSKSTSVGGTWGDSGALNVAVQPRAIDGRANAAAIDILATILDVRKRQIEIVAGQTHRTKVVEVVDPPTDLHDRLDRWRAKGKPR